MYEFIILKLRVGAKINIAGRRRAIGSDSECNASRRRRARLCEATATRAAGASTSSAGVCGSHYRSMNSGVGVDITTWLVLLQAAAQRDAARLYDCTAVQQVHERCCGCRQYNVVCAAAGGGRM
ncbi:unnamed protein product [Parnassius apollo]|uniref:(apollo) hypothetical protein n=1 Tax=Parnassius apollo TaxID=110799 RepID=A0A8S3XEX2_PARAO|nr:unnamed protein product [Parnassius apollo]